MADLGAKFAAISLRKTYVKDGLRFADIRIDFAQRPAQTHARYG